MDWLTTLAEVRNFEDLLEVEYTLRDRSKRAQMEKQLMFADADSLQRAAPSLSVIDSSVRLDDARLTGTFKTLEEEYHDPLVRVVTVLMIIKVRNPSTLLAKSADRVLYSLLEYGCDKKYLT